MNQAERTAARRLKLFKDQVVDNLILMDSAQNDFNKILSLIFDNASDVKQNQPSPDMSSNSKNEKDSAQSNDQESKPEDPQSEPETENQSFSSDQNTQLPRKIKKLYREIVKRVHPDRYEFLGIETEYQKKRAEKIFQSAKTSALSGDIEGIIQVCVQLEIDLEVPDDIDSLEVLEKGESAAKKQIQDQEKSLQMLWYYSRDSIDQKVGIIFAYLNYLGKRGKKITETLVKDVVTSYNKDGTRKKRKVGQRPAKLKR